MDDVELKEPRSVRFSWYIARTFVAFIVLSPVLGFVTLVSSDYDGFTTIIGVFIAATFGTVLSISLVSILGLPLRFVPVLRRWWLEFRPVFWIVGVVGLALVVAALLASSPETYTADQVTYHHRAPQPFLLLFGWFAFAFGVMHARLPVRSRIATTGAVFYQ